MVFWRKKSTFNLNWRKKQCQIEGNKRSVIPMDTYMIKQFDLKNTANSEVIARFFIIATGLKSQWLKFAFWYFLYELNGIFLNIANIKIKC